jgi:site-specific DNA recombinase
VVWGTAHEGVFCAHSGFSVALVANRCCTLFPLPAPLPPSPPPIRFEVDTCSPRCTEGRIKWRFQGLPECRQLSYRIVDRGADPGHDSGMKGVTYLRVSGGSQVERGGLPRQREVCEQYAAAHGIELVGEFRDEAVSGTTDAAFREGFSAMVERIAGNGVRVVLVEAADRLARDLIVSETLIAQLAKLGMRVIEARSGLDLTDATDPSRVLIRQVLGAVAQYAKSELVGKLAKNRARKRRDTGRCEGRKPYGEREGELVGLRRIGELVHDERVSLRAAAKRLNEEGIPTRGGKPWTPQAVANIAGRLAVAR